MEALSRKFIVNLQCHMLCADDLVVISDTEDDLINMLNEWKNNAENRSMTFVQDDPGKPVPER